jgi:hypothetical protein
MTLRITNVQSQCRTPIGGLLALVLLLCGLGIIPFADAECQPQTAGVLMATPLSSRLDRVGDAIQAVLEHPVQLASDLVLPSGTRLKGRVTAVKSGEPNGGPPGRLQFHMTLAQAPAIGNLQIQAEPATEGGWLSQADANTPVWQIALGRSTRLLNDMVARRMGTNQAVWASTLGIQQNVIPDISTDEFIERYHRNNLLVGAGDRIYLRFACPSGISP